jgi:formylglycine-generating enzyme required for sulfatase activity
MDPALLADALTIFLAQALPYLAKAGEEAAKEAGKKLGAGSWDKAKELWRRLRPAVEERPAAAEAVEDVAELPDDADARAALRLQLRKILAGDSGLAAELAQLLEEAGQKVSYRVEVHGEGATAVAPGAVAAGKGGKAAARDVVTTVTGGVAVGDLHGDLVLGAPGAPAPAPGASPEALREAYLHRLSEQVGYLALSGVDPAVAGREAETRLRLAAVYTALLTLAPRQVEAAEDGRAHPEGRRAAALGPERGDEGRLSAVEQVNRRRRLVLLGDPGSGKSTFVNFLALAMAGELLGLPGVGLERLTAPLPGRRDPAEEAEPQPWDHGALLPVRVVLRDFAARGLGEGGGRATAQALWRHLEEDLEEAGHGEFFPPLREELIGRGGLVLLDGLDEVPEAERRRERIKRAVEEFCAGLPHCRVLLTSRTYAYQRQEWRLAGFEEAVLAPFSDWQIRAFVDAWYAHIAELRRLKAEDAAGRAELLKRAIFASDRLAALAERPLLLTLMASLHAWRGGSLPERRERLYADTVDLLLDSWERQRLAHDAGGEPVLVQPSLAEWLNTDQERVRKVLEELAFEAHTAQPELVGTADLPQGELVGRLMALRGEGRGNPAELVEYLSHRAGLLVPRGVGIYTFPHRTFQEYLAACHLTDRGFPDRVAGLARGEPDRWREVALLAGAKAARGAGSTVWDLAEALCFREPDEPQAGAEDEWGALLAAQAVAESADLAGLGERQRRKLDRVRRWLVRLLRSERLPAVERALAGASLARLGDPRFDPEGWHLPREPLLGFVEIPAESFTMGNDRERDEMALADEAPRHEVDLPLFHLGRYPVTVGQFSAFVEASGHEPADPRCLEGLANHPVVHVTWYEALAYCRWLGERLAELAAERRGEGAPVSDEARFWSALAAGRLRATLPSEAEWEKAARGTDGRRYPWGEEADPERANYGDTGLGAPSAVGCFESGASPYGCEEMAGNVWEWTRTLWGKEWLGMPEWSYPYDPQDGREDVNASSEVARVLRGGAFYGVPGFVRCASRGGFSPDGRSDLVGFRVVLSPFSSDL